MIITCPACKRKYRLEDSLVKSPYQKMRCSKCGHVFVNQQDDGGVEKRMASPLPPDKSDQGGLVVEAAARKPSRLWGSRAVRLIVAILVLFGLAVGGYIYWMNYLGAGNNRLSIRKIEGQETITKDGRVFLVNGAVLNGSTRPRKFVILKAKIFDEQGTVIGQHLAVAGVSISAGEIAQMSRPDIEARVKETQNPNPGSLVLYPKKEIPFSIVFPGPYVGKPKEFTVEIVDSPMM
jgi:predicted Zn finger-like uncharacterized protein